MCLPFLNIFVWYDALLCGWCVAYVGDVSVLYCISPLDYVSIDYQEKSVRLWNRIIWLIMFFLQLLRLCL
jgi:hypothetical protein